jgi:TRAP-type C4-dicarboxylate transport system permease small subunit
MRFLLNSVDFINEWVGKLSAWLFFGIGFCITYEIVMRYVFNSPTIWVDEVSSITQVWATYIGLAYALKHKDMIIIDVVFRDPNTIGRKILETLGLLIIIAFSFVTLWYGFELWLDSTLKGHTTDTYLALPKWFTQASIWVGFGLLALQALVEIIKVWTIGIQMPHTETLVEEGV